jgi:hypothetical protein
MNLILQRKDFREDGIFGFLLDTNYKYLFTTLEHSYNLQPKLPQGEYTCKRGPHKLHDGVSFITFEVMDVPGHTGILIHIGNYNDESEGCILIGTGFGNNGRGGKMITSSKQAFDAFMKLQENCDAFTLTVA